MVCQPQKTGMWNDVTMKTFDLAVSASLDDFNV